jgi:hypothetical protein
VGQIKLSMEAIDAGSPFRRAGHALVYGICVIYLGITPPSPEKEVRFLVLVLAVIVGLAIMGTLFGLFLVQIVFKRS